MKQNILIYNGAQYFISVSMCAPTSQVPYDNIALNQFDILEYDNIKKLEFQNDLTNSLLYGEIIYTDNSNSVLDKFLSVSCRYLNIEIKKLGNATAASTDSILNVLTSFEHNFIVTSIKKIGQNGDKFDYRIKYVSAHWWNFNSNLLYSTHDNSLNSKKSPIDILVKLYNQAGLPLDSNNVTSNNLIDFMSSTNETLTTAKQYLMKRTYDINNLNNPGYIKILYDYIADKYSVWALNQHSGDYYMNNIFKSYSSDYVARNTIALPIYNKYYDSLLNQNPTKLDIINFDPNDPGLTTLSKYMYWTYDYVTNKFISKDISNTNYVESLPYLKNNILTTNKKYYEIDNMLSQKQFTGRRIFNKESSQWDTTHWAYDDIDEAFLNNSIISITTGGDLLRKPGDNSFLSIDNTDYSSIMGLKGDWINTRVVHTFTPTSYTNIILMSRLNVSTEQRSDYLRSMKVQNG